LSQQVEAAERSEADRLALFKSRPTHFSRTTASATACVSLAHGERKSLSGILH